MLICYSQSYASECLLRVLCSAPACKKDCWIPSSSFCAFLFLDVALLLQCAHWAVAVTEVLKSSREFVCWLLFLEIETSQIASAVSIVHADNVRMHFENARRCYIWHDYWLAGMEANFLVFFQVLELTWIVVIILGALRVTDSRSFSKVKRFYYLVKGKC